MNKEQPTNGRAAYAAGAVIEGAPMTAAEIAAQAREDQSAQRGEREQELRHRRRMRNDNWRMSLMRWKILKQG